MAAITNYHKVNKLKQSKYIILQFYRLEVWHWSYQAKIQASAGLFFLSDLIFSLPLPLLKTHVIKLGQPI